MGARCAGSQPTSKSTAIVAALLAKEPGITLRALVDDGRRWETAGKTELELVGRSLSETKATLAAGVRAVGLATSSWEVATGHTAHAVGWESAYRYATEFSSGGGCRRRIEAPVSGRRCAC